MGIFNKKKKKSIEDIVNDNLTTFWNETGRAFYYENKDNMAVPGRPDRRVYNNNKLDEKLEKCKVLILTANHVEGVTVTRCLIEHKSANNMVAMVDGDLIYQFVTIMEIPIVHIWPLGTSSFTIHGSFNALTAVFKKFTPKYVFAVGVAFGANAEEQKIGDVLISSDLLFYDAFNKYTNGELRFSPDEVAAVGDEILTGCPFLDEDDEGPSNYQLEGKPLGDYMWYKGVMLSGGTVLSDSNGKALLTKAAKAIGRDIIGGEMEGIGAYFACKGNEEKIPFVIVKGICDWGVNKNGWQFAAKELEPNDDIKQKRIMKKIKNTVQAYVCKNAFKTALFMLSEIKDTL